MLGLALTSILASFYNLWDGYGTELAASPSNAIVAILQILIFDGIISVVIYYIWALIVHVILTRSLRELVITREDFIFYFLIFMIIAKAAMAMVNVFQFVSSSLSVFTHYLTNPLFSIAAMAVFFFVILKKRFLKSGQYQRAFLSFGLIFIILNGLSYLMNVIMFFASGYFEPILVELGYSFVHEPLELYAIIAGAVMLATVVSLFVVVYFRLAREDKSIDPDLPAVDKVEDYKEERVFEEFDI